MSKITFEERDIGALIDYIHTVLDFVDVEDLEEENKELVLDGYNKFVEPITNALETKYKENPYSMPKYRLSYNGLSGFDYTGFETKEEALAWAEHQVKLGLMTPLKLMEYDVLKDEYKVIEDLSNSPVKGKHQSLSNIISQAQEKSADNQKAIAESEVNKDR